MNNKGFIFLDIIIGLFIIGLIVVVSFPMLVLTSKSIDKAKEITDMSYIAESTIENLRAKDEESLKFLRELEKNRKSEYLFPGNEKYISNVELLDEHPNLWSLNVSIVKKDVEGGGAYVQIKASIPK